MIFISKNLKTLSTILSQGSPVLNPHLPSSYTSSLQRWRSWTWTEGARICQGPLCLPFSFLCGHLSTVFECSSLARGWHLTPTLAYHWLIPYCIPTSPSLPFHPFFFSSFPSASVVCERKKANHMSGLGMRSFLSLLSRLAVCWSGLLEESRTVPFPQRAIWLHQTHAEAHLLVSFSLCFFAGGGIPKDHSAAAVDSGPVHPKARVCLALCSTPPSACRCQAGIVIIGGSMSL